MAHQETPPLSSLRRGTLAEVDVWQVLQDAHGAPRVFWQDDAGTHVGLGAAVVLEARGPGRFAAIRDQADALWARLDRAGDAGPPPRLWGGFAFHDDHEATGPWSAFPAARFWLPERTLSRIAGTWHETIVAPQDVGPGPTADLSGGGDHELAGQAVAPSGPACMDQAAWQEAVRTATAAIQDGDLAKVVLARSIPGPERHPTDARGIITVLRHLADGVGLEATFLMEPTPGHRFLGATPELLVAHDGETVTSHALAGSAPVIGDAAADAAAGEALFRSEKDILEHELVASFIRERLAGAGLRSEHGARRLRRLGAIQHLETPVHAPAEDTHVLDVVKALHPTPAVGGYPRQKSLDLIDRLEPFPRGWYAGGVGWFDAAGRGRFTVALRCGLVTPDQTWLFAGAGIVAASEADQEWAETEWKLAAMGEALEGPRVDKTGARAEEAR